jgi:hypothetical protein
VKLVARFVGVVGAVALGAWLFSAAPRDVVLVYDLPAAAARAVLEVELSRGGQAVRRAELSVPTGGGPVRHAVRLTDGDYALRWSLSGEEPARGETTVTIREDGTIVLALHP